MLIYFCVHTLQYHLHPYPLGTAVAGMDRGGGCYTSFVSTRCVRSSPLLRSFSPFRVLLSYTPFSVFGTYIPLRGMQLTNYDDIATVHTTVREREGIGMPSAHEEADD